MKGNKIISFLMVAVLSFTFSGCSQLKKEEPKIEINHKIVGKWSGKAFTGDKVAPEQFDYYDASGGIINRV